MNKNKELLLYLFIYFVGCACVGASSVMYVERWMDTYNIIFLIIYILIMFYAACFLSIILHETGHLIAGLCSGYQFSSFRVGNLILHKIDGTYHLGRYSLAGTGGQCLMTPPEMRNGHIPFIFYNIGGCLMNLLFTIISMICFYFAFDHVYIGLFFLINSQIHLITAVTNGLPMRVGGIDNDGKNTLAIMRNDEALRSFYQQMKIHDAIAHGIRLKDMDPSWFSIPSKEALQNSMQSTIAVFAANRMLDAHDIYGAFKFMKTLLKDPSINIIALYRNLMKMDCAYCEMVTNNNKEIVDTYLTKNVVKFMKSMKTNPSVLRTQFTYALYIEQDKMKANKIKQRFLHMAERYPYESDIASEMELIQLAEKGNTANFKE